MLLSLGYGKLKGLGELIRTLNAPEGEVRLDTKRMGSTCFLHVCGACCLLAIFHKRTSRASIYV